VTKISARTEPDVSLFGLAGWFLFLWVVSHVFPGTWKSPSSFDGWFSFVLSVASWFIGGLATVAIVMMYLTEERKPLFVMPLELCAVMAGWGLVFVGLVASFQFISRETNVGAPASTAVAEHSMGDPLESGIEKLRDRQVKLGTFIVELEGERSTIVNRFRQTKDQADLQVFGNELLEIDRSLKQLKDEAHAVALTITKGESLLRTIDRKKRMQEAGIDSSELNKLAVLRVEIEELLKFGSVPRSAGEVIQLDRVVREALGGKP